MKTLARSFVLGLALAACDRPETDRASVAAAALARADVALIRARPLLVAGKYARMASDPYSFYRGNLPVFRSDWEAGAFGLAASADASPAASVSETPLSLGDPHPENFGLLLAADGTLSLEPNDFDSADRAPYSWDVRRLVTGMSLAARLANPSDATANALSSEASIDIARATAEAYASAIGAFSRGAPRERLVDPGSEPVLVELFQKAAEDLASRGELAEDTLVVDGARTLVRGALSADEPTEAFEDVPAEVLAKLPGVLDAYYGTLVAPPPRAQFRILDAVRHFGSGVASWPRVRIELLVRGPSDDPADDTLLELKEIADASLVPLPAPGYAFDSVADRVLRTSRAAWLGADGSPLWGTTDLVGLPMQARLGAKGQRTVRVDKLEADAGTPAAIAGLGRALGRVLARVHATPLETGEEPARAIAAAIGGDVSGFADEQARIGDAYAAQVLADHDAFVTTLATMGPRLGVPFDPHDEPPPDIRALFGTPPEAR